MKPGAIIVAEEVAREARKKANPVSPVDALQTLRFAFTNQDWDSVFAVIIALQGQHGIPDPDRPEHPTILDLRARVVQAENGLDVPISRGDFA